MPVTWRSLIAAICAATAFAQPLRANAQPIAAGRAVTYADIADLSYAAGLVALVRIDTVIAIDPSRSTAVRPGYGRFYIEGEAKSLLVSRKPLGRNVRYLVDLPLNGRGWSDDLEGQEVFVFARRVPGKPGELQLVTPTAQLRWSPAREARLRGLLRAAVSPDAPPTITGVRALLHVPGALLGQGRTQIFLDTQDGSFASITILHRPGVQPSWHASFSELIADAGGPPEAESLEWYRLACSLPGTPPPGADISPTRAARSQAEADYRLVLDALGPCKRNLHFRPQMTAQSFLAPDQA
ncbi:hypothetical protein K426_26750 (plasmid) [Sphingobium sp. TKS]|nr:hypothetical protein K426_26750 [Sphingobium sp. TKS]